MKTSFHKLNVLKNNERREMSMLNIEEQAKQTVKQSKGEEKMREQENVQEYDKCEHYQNDKSFLKKNEYKNFSISLPSGFTSDSSPNEFIHYGNLLYKAGMFIMGLLMLYLGGYIIVQYFAADQLSKTAALVKILGSIILMGLGVFSCTYMPYRLKVIDERNENFSFSEKQIREIIISSIAFMIIFVLMWKGILIVPLSVFLFGAILMLIGSLGYKKIKLNKE